MKSKQSDSNAPWKYFKDLEINLRAHIITTNPKLKKFLMTDFFLIRPIFMKMSFREVFGAKSKQSDSNHCFLFHPFKVIRKTDMSRI